MTEIVANYLKQRYGDAVVVKYYDFAEAGVREEHPDMANAVDTNLWSLPVVAVDGKVMFAGYIDHRAIVKIIESKREDQA
ncbi:MAG: DUF1462 family protein [Dehalococcoidales bacterium]|nr:DUF1462 family protein [Dehalococcoidales bacterium]